MVIELVLQVIMLILTTIHWDLFKILMGVFFVGGYIWLWLAVIAIEKNYKNGKYN